MVALSFFVWIPPANAQSNRAQEAASGEPAGKSANRSVAEQMYELIVRHQAIGRATSLLNTAQDLGSLCYELSDSWLKLQGDPQVSMALHQLKLQYRPSVEWSLYAGGLAESSGFAGLTLGGSLDVSAPLCRYLGVEANSTGSSDDGLRVAYDTRATACLPLGPFSFELGLLRQRDLRVGLSSAPSLPSSRYNSDGFELRIRSFRWFASRWQGEVLPADVTFRSFSVPGDSAIPTSDSFQVDVSAFRYSSYEKGFLGANRTYEAFKTSVTGQQDTKVAQLSATVIRLVPFAFEGVPVSKKLYLDAELAFVQGQIVDLNNTMEPLEQTLFFGVQAAAKSGSPDMHGSLRYARRLLPDSDFRLLKEDRFDLVGEFVRYDDSASLSLFGAKTQQVAAPPGVARLARSLSYGLEGKYGRYAFGPFYMQLTATAARSYYATIGGSRLASPELEFRTLLSLIAGDGSTY